MSQQEASSQERAARNQALFREVNERVEQMNEMFDQLTPYATWVCECADTSCVESLPMTLGEYEAMREHANRFAVVPSDAHVVPEVERIVEQTDRYWLVEKVEQAATVAAELDPRSDDR